jgi:hypothetical protein
MWAFAGTLQACLWKEYYTVGAGRRLEEDVDVEALLNAVICYPRRPPVPLRELVQSPRACYDFLESLYGIGRGPFFYAYGRSKEAPPERHLKDVQWVLVLPFPLVQALVNGAVGMERRGDRAKNHATKYALDIPVLFRGTWTMLRQAQREELGHISSVQRRDSELPADVVAFSTYNCKAAVRRDGRPGAGLVFADGFETLRTLVATAHMKELWWYESLRRELGMDT